MENFNRVSGQYFRFEKIGGDKICTVRIGLRCKYYKSSQLLHPLCYIFFLLEKGSVQYETEV